MRVGIIRGDLPGPIFMADLEPTSQTNFPTEPAGQTRYVSRPNTTTVGAALASAPAAIVGTSNITFARVIDGTNDTLLLRLASSGGFTTVTIAHASYASRTTLLAAINAALVSAGLAVTAVAGTTAVRITLVTVATGSGTYLEIDTVAHGSTGNTALGLPNGLAWLIPTAAAAITSLLPVGGPLDVSTATLATVVSPVLTAAQIAAVQDSIAPRFVETDVAIKSFEVGNLAGYLKSTFTPDSGRLPLLSTGAAITAVADDGVTVFTAPVPAISGTALGTPSAGDLTITGVGLGNAEFFDSTVVKITHVATGAVVLLRQRVIAATLTGGTQGSVTATSIVIPASLIPGTVSGDKVQVKFTSLASGIATI